MVTIRSTLKKAIRSYDEPIAEARAIRSIAKHIYMAANTFHAGDTIIAPIKHCKRIIRLLGNNAVPWMQVLTVHIAAATADPESAPHRLRNLASDLDAIAETEIRQAARASRLRWRQKMIDAASDGAAEAFAYVKGSKLPPPPTDLIAAITRTFHDWKRHWCATDEPAHDNQIAQSSKLRHLVKLARPTPALLREASKSFPIATTMIDGLHPRHLVDLPDAALHVLAGIFEAWELMGDAALSSQALIVRMIPKASGGGPADRPFPHARSSVGSSPAAAGEAMVCCNGQRSSN